MNGQFRSSFFRNFGFRGPGRYDIGDVLSASQVKTYGAGLKINDLQHVGSTENPGIDYYGGLDSYYTFVTSTTTANEAALTRVVHGPNGAEYTVWSIMVPNEYITYSSHLFGFYEDGSDLFIIYNKQSTGYFYIAKYRVSDGVLLAGPYLLTSNSTNGYSFQISANSRYIFVTGWHYGGVLFDRNTLQIVWSNSINSPYEIGGGALDENYAYMSYDTNPFNRQLSLTDGSTIKAVLTGMPTSGHYILKDNFLYGFNNYTMGKYDLTTNTTIFIMQRAIENILPQDIAYDDNTFYVRSYSDDFRSVILALNFYDGSSAWAFSEEMAQCCNVSMAVSKNDPALIAISKDIGYSPNIYRIRSISKVEHFKIIS